MTKHRPLYVIAREIRRDWAQKLDYSPAKPYWNAMQDLDQVTDNYGQDSGASIVAYFLSNASGWRGAVAKTLKNELKAILKSN